MRYYCRFRGRGHSWHQVDAPSKKQAIQRFVRGSIVSPDEVLCQTNPPKGVSVVASGVSGTTGPLSPGTSEANSMNGSRGCPTRDLLRAWQDPSVQTDTWSG